MLFHWTQGLFAAIEPYNLLIIMIGSSLGIMAGAIPGISGTMALALAVPITYVMDPATALLLLVALYASSVYAGSISGILFRTPGAPEGVAATIDGHEMAKQGRAGALSHPNWPKWPSNSGHLSISPWLFLGSVW
jgi:putative tricarboxylic transport membrane protein